MSACMLGPGFLQGTQLLPLSQVTDGLLPRTAPWGIIYLHH